MDQLMTELVGGEVYQYYPLGTHIVRAPGVCGGRPTFKYTRIEIPGVLERLAAGDSIARLVHGYHGRVAAEAIAEPLKLVTNGYINSLPELHPAS